MTLYAILKIESDGSLVLAENGLELEEAKQKYSGYENSYIIVENFCL